MSDLILRGGYAEKSVTRFDGLRTVAKNQVSILWFAMESAEDVAYFFTIN